MNILILGPKDRNRNIINFLESQSHRVCQTTKPISLDFLEEKEIDFLVSFGYGPILKSPVTTAYEYRIINIHPAYLPDGRGMHPNFWSFFEGRTKGVSIHFIEDGIDTGDIIARREVVFAENETLRSSYVRLDQEVEALFFQVWDEIVQETYKQISQKESRFRYRNRVESEKLIDLLPERWDTPVKDVEDMGADFFLGSEFWKKYDRDIQPFVCPRKT